MSDILEEYIDELEENDDPLDTQEYRDLHDLAMQQFNRAQSATWAERQQALEDRRFVDIAGAQYDGEFFARFENKPKLEFNKVALSVMRIINEYRNNPITVNYVAKDGTETQTADTLDGLLRADMQSSYGDLAILNGFEEAVKGGMGAFRLVTCYEDEDDPENEKQRIKFEAIYDADTSVFFDLDAKNQDKSDARHCFVVYSISRQAFEEEFGYPAPDSMPKDSPYNWGDWIWFAPDVVYIAEWYRVEEKTETLTIWQNVIGAEERYWLKDLKENPDMEAELIATGSRRVRDRRVKRRKVHKYLISGSRILADLGVIAGKYIPIIPVYGMRSFVANMERFHGQVRNLKDPQRLFNMLVSKLAEQSAFSPISKPIFTPEQIVGHEQLWAEDNITDNPFLVVNPIIGVDGNALPAGPIAYTKPPEIAPAQAALIQLTDTAVKEIGGQAQEMQQVPANTSAAAIDSVFNRMDMQVYVFVSNLAIAVRWAGTVYLPIAQEVYTEKGRKMKTVGTQGEVSTIELMRPMATDKGMEYENDLSKASLEVVSSVGPSSTTKRQAVVRALTELLGKTADPQMQQILSSAIIQNTEGEGLADLQDYVRKQGVQNGWIKPTDEEAKAMAEAAKNAPPDPNTEYLKAATAELNAKAEAQQVDNLRTMAEIEKLRADTQKTMADTEQSNAKTLQVLEQVQLDAQQSRAEVQALLAAFQQFAAPKPEAAQPNVFQRMFGGGK